MEHKYEELFKALVKADYNNEFDVKIKEVFSDTSIDKRELCSVISTLCGVNLDYFEIDQSSDINSYIQDLKKAISEYNPNGKIVNKIKPCSGDCTKAAGKTACQASCPFNAVMINSDDHTTYIASDKCVDCGMCVDACPSGAIMDKVEFMPLLELLKTGEPVIAAVAPAIAGQFGEDVNLNQLRTAFKKIGFKDMVEVAFFADMLTLKEASEFNKHVTKKDDLMITSCCCPMWVAMIRKVYDDLVKYVSPSVSPMIAAGRVLKELNPGCKVVFVGPCIAKKAEAKEKDLLGDIDYVLTFTELKDIFDALDINPGKLEETITLEYASRGGRLYGRTGGVSTAVGEAIEKLFPDKHQLLITAQAHGVKNCKEILELAKSHNIDANFIEGMGCIGGCVGGPKIIAPKEIGIQYVNKYAEASEIKVAVDSSCMKEILSKIKITSLDDFNHQEKLQIFEREF